MKFLLDANMPRAAMRAVLDCGHTVEHVRDIGLGQATDEAVENYARASGAALVTRDLDFADIRRDVSAGWAGVVVLRMPDDSTAAAVAGVLERFLLSPELVAQLPGHLAILERSRVRFRPRLAI